MSARVRHRIGDLAGPPGGEPGSRSGRHGAGTTRAISCAPAGTRTTLTRIVRCTVLKASWPMHHEAVGEWTRPALGPTTGNKSGLTLCIQQVANQLATRLRRFKRA